jgi:hypothetical protein
MNKLITLIFILLISDCNAATGNANDGPLLAIVVLGLILLILGTAYFIDFMKSKIKDFRTKRLIKNNNIDQDGEFLNSFNQAISKFDSMPTY